MAATARWTGRDVHKRATQVCALDATGTVIDERRIATTRGRLRAVFADVPRMQLLLESSTESEWVARVLEHCGHAVIVADPNFAPMYATRSKSVKTDKRDARALADACRLGAYHASQRTSEAMRQLRDQLMVRETLIRTRTRYIAVMRARLRREGIHLTVGGALGFGARLTQLFDTGTPRGEHFPPEARTALTPLLRTLDTVNRHGQCGNPRGGCRARHGRRRRSHLSPLDDDARHRAGDRDRVSRDGRRHHALCVTTASGRVPWARAQ
jgi:hypothetical protein